MSIKRRKGFQAFTLFGAFLLQGFFSCAALSNDRQRALQAGYLEGGYLEEGRLQEEQLAAALPSFAEFFAQQPAVLLIIDPDSGAILKANPAAAEFYGYSQKALQEKRIQELNALTPEQVAEERRLAKEQNRDFFIFRHALASGELRSVQVQVHPYSSAGNTLLVSLVQDITPERFEAEDIWHYQGRLEDMVDAQVKEIAKRKQGQVLLLLAALMLQGLVIVILAVNIQRRKRLEKENQKLVSSLKEKNAELVRLSEIMAHHFQEPARRLRSFASRLKKTERLQEDKDAQVSLDFINSQAERLSRLVKDVQLYLALERKGTKKTLQSTKEALEQAIEQAEIPVEAVNWELPDTLPPLAMEKRRFQQLFTALISNAWVYRHPERRLTLALRVEKQQDRVIFQLIDNGQGIAPEYREQVFELFERLVSNAVPGTGLGLALVRKLVHQRGGCIRITDGFEGGAAFIFDLPLAESAQNKDASCEN